MLLEIHILLLLYSAQSKGLSWPSVTSKYTPFFHVFFLLARLLFSVTLAVRLVCCSLECSV